MSCCRLPTEGRNKIMLTSQFFFLFKLKDDSILWCYIISRSIGLNKVAFTEFIDASEYIQNLLFASWISLKWQTFHFLLASATVHSIIWIFPPPASWLMVSPTFPNQHNELTWCASSWAMTDATTCFSRRDDCLPTRRLVSLKVMSPQFSIAPARKSGMATRSEKAKEARKTSVQTLD